MKRSLGLLIVALLLASIPASIDAADDADLNVKKSTVFIASYDYYGELLSRGSGFYVDEGIVITNIHVIAGAGRYYRIFATNKDDSLDPYCYKDINRSDIKLNLEDDVAYLRVFINCPHDRVLFADEDPVVGEPIDIYGYPALGDSFFDSFDLVHTTGTVTKTRKAGLKEELEGTWLVTDGKIHAGNSGGPVVQDGKVVGIAVAATVDAQGKSLNGIFIPVSQVRRGLEYANDSTFGYKQQEPVQAKTIPKKTSDDPFNPIPSAGEIPSFADCTKSLGGNAEATGYSKEQGDGCRCLAGFRKDDAGKQCVAGTVPKKTSNIPDLRKPVYIPKKSSSSSSSAASVKTKSGGDMHDRVCGRVVKSFAKDQKMFDRVNERVQKRFGFVCVK